MKAEMDNNLMENPLNQRFLLDAKHFQGKIEV